MRLIAASTRAALGAVLALALFTGCGNGPPSTVPSDAGARDAARDGGIDAAAETDAGDTTDGGADVDAGPETDAGADTDAGPGTDAGPATDAGPIDSGSAIDAGEPDAFIDVPDAGPCFLADGGYDFCACDPPTGADCSTAPCAAGLACVAGPCGMHCVIAGARCVEDADCAAGSTCTSGACARSGGGCADSRDCPPGFACESGACHDRRVRCGAADADACPFGFRCRSSGAGVPFCVRVTRHCSTSAGCAVGEVCVDIEGDGTKECEPTGSCDQNADCGARRTCEARPIEYVAACGGHGPCRADTDCPVGSSCVDLWGDGIRECVEPGGTCGRTADCPGTAICGSPAAGGPPACIDRPYM